MSAILLPARALSPAGLTIAAGLGVLDTVVESGLANARLKWPNDVVVETKNGAAKLAGILVETRGLDPREPHYVVGIGVNVAQVSFPSELLAERLVTSLKTCAIDIDVDALLDRLLPHFAQRVEQIERDPRRLARDFLVATKLAGERVQVNAGERRRSGRIESFELDTGLALLADDGERMHFALEIVREMRALKD